MAETRFWLEDSAQSKTFSFGTTSASGEGLLTINKGTAAATTVVLDVKGSQNIAGDLNLTGDLNITGSVNTQTVTNTNVKDITITLNDGGTTPTDDTSGIIIEGTSNTVVGALYYKAASATKWSVGTGASQQDIVGTTATQTLTNKTIAGSQITGAITGSAATLTTPRAINGVNFDGSAAITITAAAGTLTGTTLNSSVVTSSLTSVGTIGTGVWNGTIITSAFGGTGNGFTKFSGATTAEKTYTLPDATTTILTTNYTGALGTGIVKNTTTTGALSIAVAGDFPTLNQSTTGSAATLTTTRAIYGNNFDGSAALTQIIASTYGGTGNGFTKFSGPATAEKTFTLPNASAAVLTDNAAVTVAQGGTGLQTLTAYAVLTGGTTSTGNLQQVSGLGSSGFVLTSNGAAALPTWQAPTGSAAYPHWTTVSGTQDSSNKVFTIGNALTANSEIVVLDGVVMDSGSSNDYVLSGTTLTFQAARTAPRSTSKIKVYGIY